MPRTQPNILFICTDQQYAGAMSCAGNTDVRTPAMDGLAEGGVRFTRAYCTQPLCAPVRSSFVTGRMPHETGVTDNGLPFRPELVPNALGNLLRKGGYACALAGKWHVPGVRPEECGFEVLCGTRDHAVPEVSTAFMGQGSQPFFLFASFINPHDICQVARNQPLPQGPIAPPACLDDCPNLPANFEEPPYGPEMLRFLRAWNPRVYPTEDFTPDDWRKLRHGYFRLVEKVDREIERLLDGLRAAGREEDTVVLFTSDHGDGHGAHRWNQKTSLYEEVVNVPLIASWKGVTGGRVESRLASNGLDLLPTACDFAGVRVPDGLAGLSLRPLIEGRTPSGWRQDLAIESATPIGEGPGGPPLARALVGERHKYSVYAMGRHREQLVDLATDPGEMTNLAVEHRHAGLLEAHRNRLRAWCEETGDAGSRVIP